ncbi:MAG TPA: dTDP-4-amino-4,6-dideoxygalactose transaminase [Pirellulales bacterium]|jgi:dTDP-4-amino-4,6-dideoxygalactose transaminase|nr:dTDP-4-amino-4,6-dideoxygalactose transaminase [Pirellulales bacterium]
MPQNIPFVRPYIAGNELEYVTEVVRSGKIDSDGRFTRDCAEFLEERFGIRKVLMTPSCTSALELAAMLCDLGPGDEVIMPSYTFVSTANAVALRGAKPVFVDIRPDTLNIDDRLVEEAITDRTKAIFAVHYAGVACEMDHLTAISDKYGLLLVEDAAQAVNASYNGRPLGSIGQLATYSFHTTKNYVCGEGGALAINDPALVERAEILREKGTNRSQFFRGQVDKYTWVDIGGSHLPSELSCAFLLGQLEQMDAIQKRRRDIFEFYRLRLAPLEHDGVVRLPINPDDCQTNYHMFYMLAANGAARDALLAHLREQGIGAVFHYVPLHTSPMGEHHGYRLSDLPVTENLSARLLRLPMYVDLSSDDQSRIVRAIEGFYSSGLRIRVSEPTAQRAI